MSPARRQALLLLVIAVQAASAAKPAIAAEPVRLRVLSYNIHHGEGADGKLDLPRIAKVIKGAKADLVALQEVDWRVARSGDVDQPAELARLTGMHVAFGANIALGAGEYGNAVLSRTPILESKNHALPNVDAGEQRGVLAVRIEWPAPGAAIHFLATHFDHRRDERERIASAEAINKLVDKLAEPAGSADAKQQPLMILAGDLNATPESKPLTELAKHWKNASEGPQPTIPVGRPARQIDFVLFRPVQRWKVVSTTVLDEPIASDHRPILAVLELVSE
jgi:endonuclease/exonuclease/phosphatase family metal-dependent hydrolase